MPVPNTFASATSAIPLANLDTNFATPITLGNTAVQLGNTITTINSVTLVTPTINTITSGSGSNLVLQSNNAVTAVTIDTNQNVGVQTTPSAWSANRPAIELGGSVQGTIAFNGNNSNGGLITYNSYYNGSATVYKNTGYACNYIIGTSSGSHVWTVAPSGSAGASVSSTTAMTLNNSSNGQLGIGVSPNSGWASSTYSVAQVGAYGSFYANNLNTSAGYNLYYDGTNNRYTNGGYAAVMSWASNGQIQTFTAGSGTAGNTISFTAGPYVANTGTSWTNGSDERLKNITGLITNGLESVNTLRAAKFTWKADTTNKPQVGLIAQDVQKVLPEAVNEGYTVQGDETQYLGVAYTEVIPLLVAAIQELSAKVTALEAKVGI